MNPIYPGIWKLTFGEPEALTPVRLFHQPPKMEAFDCLPNPQTCPLPLESLRGKKTQRGYTLEIPLKADEQIYGLGLQLLSYNQRLKKKTVRVNSDPKADLGDSHAPAPFYVSTAGYGILIDTARYTTIYFGPSVPRQPLRQPASDQPAAKTSQSPEELYAWLQQNSEGPTLVDIPACDGVDVYIFAGPSLRQAVQRYNLFSGGGCLPPRWGLGVWYRPFYQFNQEQAVQLAETIRRDGMPCDVYGLEPGWQSHAYSCSFTWNDAFPDPQGMIRKMDELHYRVNLWTHAFTHPTSPIYQELLPYSGDYQVWGGLVPDLLSEEARQSLAGQYDRDHVALGISGYKLDECDNSDFVGKMWSFPELSQFPSGADGEVMHSLFGLAYQKTVEGIFWQRNQRTYGSVRSSHALAAPHPFVLYSDLYDHRDFIRALVNCGFSGLLWTPEVRDASSEEDLIRRLQAVVLSPQALINAWYIKNPPWKQWQVKENNEGKFLEDYPALQAACRNILNLRMRLIPYLYAAFYRYYLEGMPPFRALVMDYPEDADTYAIDDQWLIGDRLMAAPFVAGQKERSLYLPAGEWFDFWSGARIEGGRKLEMQSDLEIIPLFVRGQALLPLAQPTQHTDDPAGFNLEVWLYGDGSLPCTLYEDDGTSLAYQNGEFNRLTLTWDAETQQVRQERQMGYGKELYRITGWKSIQP